MVTSDLSKNHNLSFKAGGEMGGIINELDWSQTQLGASETWPASLWMTLRMVLSSKFPMLLCWGPEHIQFYNDAHQEVLSRFSEPPKAIGQPAEDCWPEIWSNIKPLINTVFINGSSTLTEDFPFYFYKNEVFEESYWTFSISPVFDEAGTRTGVLLMCTETTALVNSRRNISQLLNEEQALNEELLATNEELTEANSALLSVNEEMLLVEKQLKESEGKYRTVFQFSPLPMWIYDPETLKILEVNERAVIKYGYTREEFVTKSLLDIRPPDEKPKFLTAQQRVKGDKGLHLTGIFNHLTKDGAELQVEVYGHQFEYKGKECVMVITNDITEKVKTLNLLNQKDYRLTTATAIAKLGYWQVGVDGKERYWSDEVFNIWMVPMDTDLNDWNFLLAKIHPDDKEYFAVEQNASLGAVKDVNLEYRVIMPDGAIKWVHEIGKVVRDENGNPLRIQGTIQDITSQKLLAISLQESNKRFQYAAQATSQAIWEWDAAQPTVFKEYGYRELFGHKLCGNTGEVAFWRSKVHPEDYDRIWPEMDAARSNPNIGEWAFEYRFKKADGLYLYLKEKAILLRDERGILMKMIGSMHDITRRKNEERHLKLLESVITNTHDGVLVTLADPLDEPGPTIIYANDSFAEMTGYSVGELLGQSPRILQGLRSDKEELSRLSAALRNQEPCEINTINYRKNGEEYWANISVSPVKNDQGVVSHYIAIQRDITERKKEEAEFNFFADDLYKRNQELQQFGYLVSHNLRSPVANIIGIADLLELDKDDPGTIEKCAADLKSSVTRLDEVIRDMSKILSITDKTVELLKEPINLNGVLSEIILDLKDTIKRFEVEIEYPVFSYILVSHKAYLYSIFHNLITNAIKYRSEKNPRINITISQENDAMMIMFSDNGVGIDLSRHSAEVFKPYRRFHSQIEGKGLGLFLVKSHIEALNGNIHIESLPGKGTTFKIIIPV